MLASASLRFDPGRSGAPDVAAIAALLLALMPKGERFLERLSVQ